jgi:hypothetical protein
MAGIDKHGNEIGFGDKVFWSLGPSAPIHPYPRYRFSVFDPSMLLSARRGLHLILAFRLSFRRIGMKGLSFCFKGLTSCLRS